MCVCIFVLCVLIFMLVPFVLHRFHTHTHTNVVPPSLLRCSCAFWVSHCSVWGNGFDVTRVYLGSVRQPHCGTWYARKHIMIWNYFRLVVPTSLSLEIILASNHFNIQNNPRLANAHSLTWHYKIYVCVCVCCFRFICIPFVLFLSIYCQSFDLFSLEFTSSFCLAHNSHWNVSDSAKYILYTQSWRSFALARPRHVVKTIRSNFFSAFECIERNAIDLVSKMVEEFSSLFAFHTASILALSLCLYPPLCISVATIAFIRGRV